MKQAFTLIELLVVIAIIGLLSLFIVINLQDARVKAKATDIIKDVKAIESAIQLAFSNDVRYPTHNELCDEIEAITGQSYSCSIGPDILDLQENGLIDINVTPFPELDQSFNVRYRYHANPDVSGGALQTYDYGDCSTGSHRGVSILAQDMMNRPLGPEIFDYLDTFYDGGDGSLCGKIHRGTSQTSTVYIQISEHHTLYP